MVKLKADAVPTLFPHLKLPQKRRSSEHRAEELQKRAFVADALAKTLSPPPMYSEISVQTTSSLVSKETQTPHLNVSPKVSSTYQQVLPKATTLSVAWDDSASTTHCLGS